jgi:hypothetical protein
LPARREEDLGGGRASWLVPFGVISRNTSKPPQRKRGRRNTEEVGARPPPKGPPPESKEKRKEKRLRKRERVREGRAGEKKDVDGRKK